MVVLLIWIVPIVLPDAAMTVRAPVGVAASKKVADPQLKVSPVTVVLSTTVPVVPVIVNVPEPQFIVRVCDPDELHVVKVRLGLFAEKSSVPVNAPAVSEANVEPLMFAAAVTVPPPDETSKVTASVEDGTETPPAPPDVDAQCVVVELSHVPVPPTQKQPPPVPQTSANAGDENTNPTAISA